MTSLLGFSGGSRYHTFDPGTHAGVFLDMAELTGGIYDAAIDVPVSMRRFDLVLS
jgi:hypothetical protein